jgi:hypothetical protein
MARCEICNAPTCMFDTGPCKACNNDPANTVEVTVKVTVHKRWAESQDVELGYELDEAICQVFGFPAGTAETEIKRKGE